MAKEAGLVMNRPALTPSTRLALEATEYAKLKGVGEEFHMAAYAAYWSEGVDLGKVENLKPIGESVGLDGSDLSHHLEERTHKESVENQYQEALGVGEQKNRNQPFHGGARLHKIDEEEVHDEPGQHRSTE